MRRFKIAVLMVAALALGASAARAETNWVGVNAGLSMPMGDFADFASTGFHVGGSGTWMFKPAWGVGVDLGYHMWGGKDEPAGVDVSANAIQVSGHYLYMFPSDGNMKPWVKGGLGIYNVGAKVEGAGPGFDFDDSESNFGYNVGGGVNLKSSDTMSYGIGAAFHTVMTEDESTNFFTISANLLFGVGGPQ